MASTLDDRESYLSTARGEGRSTEVARLAALTGHLSWVRSCGLAGARSGDRGDHALPGGDPRAAAGAGCEGWVPLSGDRHLRIEVRRGATGRKAAGTDRPIHCMRRSNGCMRRRDPVDSAAKLLHSTTQPGGFDAGIHRILSSSPLDSAVHPLHSIAECTGFCDRFQGFDRRMHRILRSLPGVRQPNAPACAAHSVPNGPRSRPAEKESFPTSRFRRTSSRTLAAWD